MKQIELNESVEKKVRTLIYYETDGKEDELKILKGKIDDILKVRLDVNNINVSDVDGGYMITIDYVGGYRKLFCFTLSEVFIHLRYV